MIIILGTVRFHDDDDNENVKKAISLDSRRKSQRSLPRPSRLCISVSYEQAGQSEGLGNRKFTCDYKLQQTRVEITHFFQNTVKIILAVIKVLFSFS